MSTASTSSALFTLSTAKTRSVGRWATSASLVTADVIALSAVYWIAVLARYLLNPNYSLAFYLHLFPGILLFLLAFLLQGLYPGILIHPAEEIRRVFYGITTVFLLVGAAIFIVRDAESYSRSIFLITWSAGLPAILLARTFVRRKLSATDWWGVPAVVFGSGPAAQRVATELRRRPLGLRVLGVLEQGEFSVTSSSDSPPVLGPLSYGPVLAAQRFADYAIVAMPELSNAEARNVIQEHCRGFRHVLLMPDLPYACSLDVSARDVGGELGIEVPQRLFHLGARLAKRGLDVVGSALILLLLSPLLALIAVLVKLTSKGTVLYGHPRHGLRGDIFKALKFRSMVVNGSEVLENYFREHPEQRQIWETEHKLRTDPRITAVGKWLRRYSLDELPQLWNVLAGQMTLVGPRPIVPNEIDKYGESFAFCTSVRPGITGMWQVSGRNDLSFGQRIHLNEYYIRNWSVWLDMYLLFRTVRVVIGGEGAY